MTAVTITVSYTEGRLRTTQQIRACTLQLFMAVVILWEVEKVQTELEKTQSEDLGRYRA